MKAMLGVPAMEGQVKTISHFSMTFRAFNKLFKTLKCYD